MAKVKKPIAVLPGIWEHDAERVVEGVLPSGVPIRVTVGWLSGYQTALWRVLRSEAVVYSIEKYGEDPMDLLADEAPLSEKRTEVQSWFERAIALSALRKVEVEQDGEWLETELPPSWRDVDTFKFSIPEDLQIQWVRYAIDLNPQIFSVKQDEDEKKDEPPAVTTLQDSPKPSLTQKKKPKTNTTNKSDLPPSN